MSFQRIEVADREYNAALNLYEIQGLPELTEGKDML